MDPYLTSQPPRRPQESAWAQAEEFKGFRRAVASLDLSSLIGLGERTALSSTAIAGFELVRPLGSGAQGVVYEAIEHSTQRRVAIKVLRLGPLARPRDRYRFEREVEALGKLRHPNVVALHGAGSVEGCHYLIMDYIDGVPLHEYLSPGKLPLKRILGLFGCVCDAVHAGHLKGIIHRDIKPQNIIVESGGTPFVVDFGLARLDQDDRESSGHAARLGTLTGQIIGTPIWASPEQTEGGSADIDLRTDVYSLGVVLYYVLTGEMPYDTTGPFSDVYERIRHTPPKPPHGICREIKNDLETVLLKTLAKEPDRRYQSAAELAHDIRCCLKGEAIAAKRDSSLYVIHKYLRKHWLPASLAAAFVIAIAVGGVAALIFSQQADAERDRADHRARVAESTIGCLLQVLHALEPMIEKQSSAGYVRNLLDQQVESFEASPVDDPEVEFEIRRMFATLYYRLGDYAAADAQGAAEIRAAHQAFGANHERVSGALSHRAWIRGAMGDHATEESLFREAAAILKDIRGEYDFDYIQTLCQIAECRRHQDDHSAYESIMREVMLLLGDSHPECLKSFAEWLCDEQERYDEALALQRKALELVRREGTEEQVAHNLHSIAHLLRKMGSLEEAERLQRECVDFRERAYAGDHVNAYYIWVSKGLLGQILADQKRFSEAESLLLEAFENFVPREDRYLTEVRHGMAGSIASLYERWDSAEPGMGYADEAAEWRAKTGVVDKSGLSP